METDRLVDNPLMSFMTEQAEKKPISSGTDGFALRRSQLQLEDIEQSLTDFLKKSQKQQRVILRDYSDFFVDLGECVYDDGMETLSSVALDMHNMPEVDSYLKQLQKVSRLLGQVLIKVDDRVPKSAR
ncbi:MAG: hypothetical protein LBG64_03890 [Pseudomonadales bacterium]|jgi:hypothetical protein|nr:hypothetical protein [Pseudomonadales bacterium]